MITPNKRIAEEDERSVKPARYTTPSKPVKEYSSTHIDDDTDLDDEEKNKPKLKIKEHVSSNKKPLPDFYNIQYLPKSN